MNASPKPISTRKTNLVGKAKQDHDKMKMDRAALAEKLGQGPNGSSAVKDRSLLRQKLAERRRSKKREIAQAARKSKYEKKVKFVQGKKVQKITKVNVKEIRAKILKENG